MIGPSAGIFLPARVARVPSRCWRRGGNLDIDIVGDLIAEVPQPAPIEVEKSFTNRLRVIFCFPRMVFQRGETGLFIDFDYDWVLWPEEGGRR